MAKALQKACALQKGLALQKGFQLLAAPLSKLLQAEPKRSGACVPTQWESGSRNQTGFIGKTNKDPYWLVLKCYWLVQ